MPTERDRRDRRAAERRLEQSYGWPQRKRGIVLGDELPLPALVAFLVFAALVAAIISGWRPF